MVKRNPLIRKIPQAKGKTEGGHKSAGILDDFSVRKNVATREGTIEKVPVNDSDIVNKKYVDSQISGISTHWDDDLTYLHPTIGTRGMYVLGVVGIGTATPNTKLRVVGGDIGINKSYFIKWLEGGTIKAAIGTDTNDNLNFFTTGGSNRLTILDGGNVGIGTTKPVGNLHINKNSGSSSYLHITNDDTGTTITDGLLIGMDSSEKTYIVNRENTDFFIKTNDINRLMILANGNVGIGLTDPGEKLSVAGNVMIGDSAWSDGTTTGDLAIQGNVGIGTTLPTSMLQVIGIPVYADNAAAITGGLTAGAFYRTGSDPDPVCVVH